MLTSSHTFTFSPILPTAKQGMDIPLVYQSSGAFIAVEKRKPFVGWSFNDAKATSTQRDESTATEM